jgi:hypothetical protein
MANDAARQWVAPYFSSMDAEDADVEVHVLNVSASDATVTVTFHDHSGVRVDSKSEPVSRNETRTFVSTRGTSGGWVRVVSNQPVFTSGTMPLYSLFAGQYFFFIQMTFYRAEGIDIQEKVRVPADSLPRPRAREQPR